MTALVVLLWVIAVYLVLGMLLTIAAIGKPRQTVTAGVAIINLIIGAFFVGIIIAAASTLAS